MTRFGTQAKRLAGAASALLGWTPDQFWSATPIELIDALQAGGDSSEPADRATIEALMERFPDMRGFENG